MPAEPLADRLAAAQARYERLIDELTSAELRYRELVERIPAVVYVADAGERPALRYLSPQVEPLLGHPPEAFVADPGLWRRLVHPDDRAGVAGTRRPVDREYRMVAADGRVVWLWERGEVVADAEGRPLFVQGVLVDVTRQREAERQVAHLAYHDALTALPNRALLREHLALSLARARRGGDAVALLHLDLDDFRLVNDSLGHAAGDDLLCRIATELRGRTRATDLLARLGGDEFLVLLSDLPAADALPAAQAAAEQVMGALAEPFAIAGEEFHVGGSIGIAAFPRDADDADALLEHAEAAMYQAKAGGRSEIAVYAAAGERSLRRLSLSTRLRRAIAADELTLHWQPIVSPRDGGVTAVEALVRWEDPAHGLVSPGDFVPFAEETGLIDRLGAWVADAVGAQRAAWRARGVAPAVHLNVSPRQLARRGFVADLVGRLRTGGAPDGVVVEITESAAVREDGGAAPLLRELAEAGLRVAIDDFGAGFSSLARLRDLPAHQVKIDRSFLAGVPRSRQAGAMVEAILALAGALEMEAVAEGVETAAQRAFLAARACPRIQGYLVGRPLPASELEPRLRESGACSIPT